MLLICDFSGEEQIFTNYWEAPLPVLLNWVFHCIGAFWVFGTAGVLAFLYTQCVEGVGGFLYTQCVEGVRDFGDCLGLFVGDCLGLWGVGDFVK